MRSAAMMALAVLAGCQDAPQADKPAAADVSEATAIPAPLPTPSAPSPEPSSAPAKPPQHFQALGTEPFWSFEVLPGKLIYSSPEVQQGMVIAARFSGEGKRLRFSGTMEGKPVVLTIEPGTCSDGMSDTVYAYKANFTWGEQTEQGCARLK